MIALAIAFSGVVISLSLDGIAKAIRSLNKWQ